MLLESLDDFELLLSFEGLGLVALNLDLVPSLLNGQTVFSIIKEDLKYKISKYSFIFKIFDSIFDGLLEINDGVLEEGLSLAQSFVFFLEVSTLGSPIFGLFLFLGQEGGSRGNQLLSDLGQQFEDLNDALVVNLGGQLSECGDEGLFPNYLLP